MLGADHPFAVRGLNARDENGNEGCAVCGRVRGAHPQAVPEVTPEPLVMAQDEYQLVRWVFEMTGGPAFPGNAATACRIAARMNAGGNGEVFRRLAEAIAGARNAPESTLPPSVPDDTGQDPSAALGQAGTALGADLRARVSAAIEAAWWSRSPASAAVMEIVWPLIESAAADRAKLAALRSLCDEGAPAVAVDRIEAVLRGEEGSRG